MGRSISEKIWRRLGLFSFQRFIRHIHKDETIRKAECLKIDSISVLNG